MYVVQEADNGLFYRRGKLVHGCLAASFGHSPSGVAGIMKRARASYPALRWQAVPLRDALAAARAAEARR